MHAELVHCVLDVAGWLKPHLWGSSFANDRHSVKYYSEAHEARYFIVECRERDGAACFWYKPDPTHDTICG